MTKLLLSDVLADPEFNCRGEIDPISVSELASSMAAQGLLQPILVMQIPGPLPWKVVAGHRRIAAARLLKWADIEVIITANSLSDGEHRKANLVENMARKDLTPSQEMRAIVAIYGDKPNTAVIAKDLGMSRKWVQDRLRLRMMEKRILDKADEGLLGAVDLQYLSATLPEERWTLAERLMVKGQSTREIARELKLRKKIRGLKEVRLAIEVIQDLGRHPSWLDALKWCSDEMGSEEFFGKPLDKLRIWGIIR